MSWNRCALFPQLFLSQARTLWEGKGMLVIIIPGWQRLSQSNQGIVTLTTALITPFLKFPLQGLESKVSVFYLYILGMVPGTMEERTDTYLPQKPTASQQQSHADNLASRQPRRPSPHQPASSTPRRAVLTSFSRSSSELNLAWSSTCVSRRFFSSSAARDAASSSFYPIESHP